MNYRDYTNSVAAVSIAKKHGGDFGAVLSYAKKHGVKYDPFILDIIATYCDCVKQAAGEDDKVWAAAWLDDVTSDTLGSLYDIFTSS